MSRFEFESKILNRLKEGDLSAYELIYSKLYAELCNYIFKLSKNRVLAEDIVQDAFILLWDKRKQINPEFSIFGYLLKICHNQFLQHIRQKKKERKYLDEIKASVFYESYKENIKEERLKQIKTIIDKLSPKCKQAFVFSKFEQMTYDQISEKMGISKKTVEAHISKAYAEIRKKVLTTNFILF